MGRDSPLIERIAGRPGRYSRREADPYPRKSDSGRNRAHSPSFGKRSTRFRISLSNEKCTTKQYDTGRNPCQGKRETEGRRKTQDSSLKPQASSLKPQVSSLKSQDLRLKPQASSLKSQASSLKPQASSLKPQASSLKPKACFFFCIPVISCSEWADSATPGEGGKVSWNAQKT